MRYFIDDNSALHCDNDMLNIVNTYGLASREVRSIILIGRIERLRLYIDKLKAELKDLGVDYE